MNHFALIDRLNEEKALSHASWVELISHFTEEDSIYAAALARRIAVQRFGTSIYFRGIIEFTNICKNDCLYCGIRRSNRQVSRYRLTKEEILECCQEGYEGGFRTFVLQGGEDPFFDDQRMCEIVRAIRAAYPDCAVTLSLGERSRASYEALREAGASRYLLRHETATECHYNRLHPPEMSFSHRMQCLQTLKELGYQTGCGCMVGSPFQTPEHLAADMEFICAFRPQMVGMGPFIPHRDTPFRDQQAGSETMTLFLLSLTRIALPDVLLPATTALGTVDGDGRKLGVLAGCNVVMPNLSPLSVRQKYLLYDNKAGVNDSAADGVALLRRQMAEIGYTVAEAVGDYRERKVSL